ncbi:hypothetical protein OGATHE_005579 [Ogataea polymorpha]|uniref:Uncharacterized protein n=1 Tax=Ogataea polymorpha TaxID=460523 RepID=A0A9P8NUY3_9ASCO|nr:hypothetical protein OGATHE_005579 [Ogataea polymorpha]
MPPLWTQIPKPLKSLPRVDDPELQKLLGSPEFVQYLKEPVIQLNIRIINEILNDVSITQEYNAEGRTEIATRKISNLRNKGLEQNAAFDEFCNLVLNLLAVGTQLAHDADQRSDFGNRKKQSFRAQIRQAGAFVKFVLVDALFGVCPIHDVVMPVQSVRTRDVVLDDFGMFPVVLRKFVEGSLVWLFCDKIAERADPEVALRVNGTLIRTQWHRLFEVLLFWVLGHVLELLGLQVILAYAVFYTTDVDVWVFSKRNDTHAGAHLVLLHLVWVIQEGSEDLALDDIHPA